MFAEKERVFRLAAQAENLIRDAAIRNAEYSIGEEELVLFGSAALFLQGGYRIPRDLDYSVYDGQIFDLVKTSLLSSADRATVVLRTPNSIRVQFDKLGEIDTDVVLLAPLYETYVLPLRDAESRMIVCEKVAHIVERRFHSQLGALELKGLIDFIFLFETDAAAAERLIKKYPKRRLELLTMCSNESVTARLLTAELVEPGMRQSLSSKVPSLREMISAIIG
jgi:hypothetical protein